MQNDIQDEKTGEWLSLLEINSGVGRLNWEEDTCNRTPLELRSRRSGTDEGANAATQSQ